MRLINIIEITNQKFIVFYKNSTETMIGQNPLKSTFNFGRVKIAAKERKQMKKRPGVKQFKNTPLRNVHLKAITLIAEECNDLPNYLYTCLI